MGCRVVVVNQQVPTRAVYFTSNRHARTSQSVDVLDWHAIKCRAKAGGCAGSRDPPIGEYSVLKRARLSTQAAHGTDYESYMRSLDDRQRQKIEGKREYFFKRIDPKLRAQIQMDEEAAYSVTEVQLAEESSKLILSELGLPDGANVILVNPVGR